MLQVAVDKRYAATSGRNKSSADLPAASIADADGNSGVEALVISSGSASNTMTFLLTGLSTRSHSAVLYGSMALIVIGVVLLVVVIAQLLTDNSRQERDRSRSSYGWSGAPGSGRQTPVYRFRNNLPNFQQDRYHAGSRPSSGGGSVAEPAFGSAQQYQRQSRPPAMCSELVSMVDSTFAVSFNAIELAAGPVPIYGHTGKLLLSADSRKDPMTGQGIVVMSLSPGDGALGCVESCGAGPMEVRDRLGTPYGEFLHVGSLTFRLTLRAIEVLRLHYDPSIGEMLMRSSADGSVLASAGKMPNPVALPPNEEYMQVQVCSGMDPIIALLLIIASMTFNAD
jgi:hypothetical protein